MIDEFIKSTKSVSLLILFNALILVIGFNYFNIYGLPLVIFGGFIYFYNRHVMGKTWSVKVEAKKNLVTAGLFKHVRHPLYLGMLIVSLGAAFTLMNPLLLLATIFINLPFTYKRAIIEEDLLSKSLKGYKEYMRKTKMFFPKLF